MTRTIIAYGPTLTLATLLPSDAPRLLEMLSSPKVAAGLARTPAYPQSLEQVETNIRETVAPESYQFGIMWKDTLIGRCGLHHLDRVNRDAVLVMMIRDESCGKGFGQEATKLLTEYGFQHLNLHRIELTVFARNARAIRCYEKCGFEREGLCKQAVWKDGGWIDSVIMAKRASTSGS